MRGPKAGGAQLAGAPAVRATAFVATMATSAGLLLLVASSLLLLLVATCSHGFQPPPERTTPQGQQQWMRTATKGAHRHIGHGHQQHFWRHRLQRPQVAAPSNSMEAGSRYWIGEGGGGGSFSVSQEVPEQTAVVVSSSDNSYVSASPVVVEHRSAKSAPFTTGAPQMPLVVETGPSLSNVSDQFQCRPATIIKTRESLAAGASFINYTLVTSLNACLVECWITDSCDTAIYQESPVDFGNHLPLAEPEEESFTGASGSGQLRWALSSVSQQEWRHQLPSLNLPTDNEPDDQLDGFYLCYLFQCANSQGFKCQFSAHNYYVSATSYQAPPHQQLAQVNTKADKGFPESSYSKLISSRHWLPVRDALHEPLSSSIRIGREVDERRAGFNSALIALLFGVGATSVLLMIVARKMASIRRRAASQGRNHRSPASPQRPAAVAEAVAVALATELEHQRQQQLLPELSRHHAPQVNGSHAEIIKKATSSVFVERPRRSLLRRTARQIRNLLLATNGIVRFSPI